MARTIRILTVAAIWAVVLAASARDARCDAELISATEYLNWGTCTNPLSNPVQSFACNNDSGPSFDLILTLIPFTQMTDAVSSSVLLWFQSNQPTMPDWWQVQPGGCRAGDFTVDSTAPFPAGCADPWLGQATIVAEFQPACAPNGFFLSLRSQLPPGQTRTLVQGTRYAMFRMRINRDRTTGVGACGGCSYGACFGFEVISIGNSSGLGWSSSPGGMASWQTTAGCNRPAYCGPTEASRPTWGAIKSLYR